MDVTFQAGQELEPAVKAERERLIKLKKVVGGDLEYIQNKLTHLYNAMLLATDCFDSDKPENRFSLSTFSPVVAEVVDDLEDTKNILLRGGEKE